MNHLFIYKKSLDFLNGNKAEITWNSSCKTLESLRCIHKETSCFLVLILGFVCIMYACVYVCVFNFSVKKQRT